MKATRQTSITGYTSSDRLDKLHEAVANVQKSLGQVIANVDANRKDTKRYTDKIVTQIAESTTQISSALSSSSNVSSKSTPASTLTPTAFKPTFAKVVGIFNAGSPRSFPPLNSRTPKRMRYDDSSSRPSSRDTTPKSSSNVRQTVSGTSTDHGLTAPIRNSQKPQRQSHTSKFTKSLYLRNFAPTVTVEIISSMIKRKIVNADDSNFSVRLLVKKDQQLDDLTFVSFRLMCTEEIFPKCSDPAIWPDFAEIGEWIERPRKTRRVAEITPEEFVVHADDSETEPGATPVPHSVVDSSAPNTEENNLMDFQLDHEQNLAGKQTLEVEPDKVLPEAENSQGDSQESQK